MHLTWLTLLSLATIASIYCGWEATQGWLFAAACVALVESRSPRTDPAYLWQRPLVASLFLLTGGYFLFRWVEDGIWLAGFLTLLGILSDDPETMRVMNQQAWLMLGNFFGNGLVGFAFPFLYTISTVRWLNTHLMSLGQSPAIPASTPTE